MESRSRNKNTVERATKIIAERGRAYIQRNKYRVVHVFSQSLTELDTLRQAYGGNYYPHGVGYTWMLQRRVDIMRLATAVKPHLQEDHGLEALYQPLPTK
jgi:hypothetical protein